MPTHGNRIRGYIGLLIAASCLAAILQLTLPGTVADQGVTVIDSRRLEGELPVLDPADSRWDLADPVEVPLSGQVSVAPMKMQPLAPSMTVRSLRNESWIAFHIAWADPVKDNRTTGNMQFRDAVAVQFAPAGVTANLCMGGKDQRLHIMQWKADWQADIEEGFRDLQDHYPRFWTDVYPYAIGSPPYEVPEAFNGTARNYLVGWKVGNPFSQPLKATAVEEIIAEGFGTTTTQAQQDALGRGVWDGAGWRVVLARPLASGDADDVAIGKKAHTVAFAVWDGAAADVGARKSTSSWMTLHAAGQQLPGPGTPQLSPTLLGIAGTLLFIGIVVAVGLLGGREPPKESNGGEMKGSGRKAPDRTVERVKKRGGDDDGRG